MYYSFIIIITAIIALYLYTRQKTRSRLNEIAKNSSINFPDSPDSSNELLALINIDEYINNNFNGQYIDDNTYKNIYDLLCTHYPKARQLDNLRKFLCINDEICSNFIYQFEHISTIVQLHNDSYLQQQLNDNKDFFDTVLKYPLDKQQRRAIVSEACNCLVVSSAGSGKTSSIVGKVKYLIEKKHIQPEQILLISYTNKAATELTERINIPQLKGYTFHKLAIDIIGNITKEKPSICDNTDSVFVGIFRDMINNASFKQSVLKYFIDYQVQQQDWEKRQSDKKNELSEAKRNKYKAVFPDMDNNPIYVKSEQEQKICFVLSSLGLNFRYEEPYEHNLSDEMYSQYKPDFSIYYHKNGKEHRIYLENFGIDEHGLVPVWFAENKGITYEEANKQYGDGITWKREVHKKYGTTLLETTSADFHYSDIKEKLKNLLKSEGVPFNEIPDETLYNLLLPKGSQQEKVFIRLAITFITLLKTNCKSINDVLSKIKNDKDERSYFIVQDIILPMYKRYEDYLSDKKLKDFTDLIIEATSLFNQFRPIAWKYIIVDEFQDISVDRYHFLKVLRDGNIPAKLFCVGDDWQSIYRFSGSDIALFNQFHAFFGDTETNKIETTFRFGNPLVALSSEFIQRNPLQIKKNITPFSESANTDLQFKEYERSQYSNVIAQTIASIPADKSIFLLGRYSFDDYYLSFTFKSIKRGNKFYYIINNREIEFLTVHKSKGLEADYAIILQCNNDTFGFPSIIGDDPILNHVLSRSDNFPFGEERRLFYVAITRAKEKTIVLYDKRYPSIFVTEFLHPEQIRPDYSPHKNANKHWSRGEERLLIKLFQEGKSTQQISRIMERSQTAVVMRLQRLGIVKY